MGFDDDFDLMGDSDDFGGDSDDFGGFEDSGGFGSFEGSGGFGDSDGFGGSEDFGSQDEFDDSDSGDSSEDSEEDQLEFEDDEDDFLDGVDDYQQAAESSDPLESSETKATEIKRTALFAVGLGLIVLVIILFLGRMLSNYRKTQNNSVPQQTVETTVKNNSKIKNNDVTVAETQQAPISKTYTGDEGWVEIERNTSIPDGIKTEGIFTVTDVRHYAKVANAKNDKQIRSIVTGNISGVVGTFEFEVPFSKASKLSDGLSFKIEYLISENNGYKIVEILDF